MTTKTAPKATPKATPKGEAKAEVEESTTISIKDLATRCNTSPKDFRRWLRSQTTNRAGKGGRWTFSPDNADELVERFNARKTKGTDPELIDD